jgi:hypothetical protein
MAEQAPSLKHRVRPDKVTVSDTDCALLVEYIQEAYQVLPDGAYGPMVDKTRKIKKVKVRNDIVDANVDELLQELLEKAKMIKPISQDVRECLVQLQKREVNNRARSDGKQRDVAKVGHDAERMQENQPQRKLPSSVGKLPKSDGKATTDSVSKQKAHKSRREKISSACRRQPCS